MPCAFHVHNPKEKKNFLYWEDEQQVNVSIKTKLILGFLSIIVLIGIIGAGAVINFSKVNQISYLVGEVYGLVERCSDQIEIAILECRRAEKNFFLRQEDKYIKRVQDEVERIRSNIKRIKGVESYIEIPVSLDKINELTTEYLKEFNKAVKLPKENISENIPLVFVGRELQSLAPKMAEDARNKVKEEIEKISETKETTRIMIAIAVTIASIIALVIGFFRDISELARLQKQLIQAEKLASVGRLAAGVAHEINNPLTGILTYGHFLKKKAGEINLVQEYSEIIINETMRCRKIIRGLLDFARQPESEKKLTDINKIVKDTLLLIEHQASMKNVKILTELNEQLPMITVDSNQIQEVFMNIILNALDAMPDGGLLTISSDSLPSFGGAGVGSIVDGRYIEIKFTDTGCGIPEENLNKLFDPFFTTKKVGEGTGLGLFVSHGIIEEHNGTIEVQSEIGKGSTFVVKLPVE
jgi:signal transduction histidine kinase